MLRIEPQRQGVLTWEAGKDLVPHPEIHIPEVPLLLRPGIASAISVARSTVVTVSPAACQTSTGMVTPYRVKWSSNVKARRRPRRSMTAKLIASVNE